VSIPEPSDPLWLAFREWWDQNIWPSTDEAMMKAMGEGWHDLGNQLQVVVDDAKRTNQEIPQQWRDAVGGIFTRNLGTTVGELEASIQVYHDMGKLCTDYAQAIADVRNGIYAELALNAAFFAATLLFPPAAALFWQARLFAGMALRIGGLVGRAMVSLSGRAAATIPAGLLRAGSLTGRAVTSGLREGAEGFASEAISQGLSNLQGYRNGWDEKRLWVSTGAEILGGGFSHVIKPIGRIGAAPANWLADKLRLSERGRPRAVLNEMGHGFVVNGATSPPAGVIAQAVADGNLHELNWGTFGKAWADQAVLAGALGATRSPSVHAGQALGGIAAAGIENLGGTSVPSRSELFPTGPPGGSPASPDGASGQSGQELADGGPDQSGSRPGAGQQADAGTGQQNGTADNANGQNGQVDQPGGRDGADDLARVGAPDQQANAAADQQANGAADQQANGAADQQANASADPRSNAGPGQQNSVGDGGLETGDGTNVAEAGARPPLGATGSGAGGGPAHAPSSSAVDPPATHTGPASGTAPEATAAGPAAAPAGTPAATHSGPVQGHATGSAQAPAAPSATNAGPAPANAGPGTANAGPAPANAGPGTANAGPGSANAGPAHQASTGAGAQPGPGSQPATGTQNAAGGQGTAGSQSSASQTGAAQPNAGRGGQANPDESLKDENQAEVADAGTVDPASESAPVVETGAEQPVLGGQSTDSPDTANTAVVGEQAGALAGPAAAAAAPVAATPGTASTPTPPVTPQHTSSGRTDTNRRPETRVVPDAVQDPAETPESAPDDRPVSEQTPPGTTGRAQQPDEEAPAAQSGTDGPVGPIDPPSEAVAQLAPDEDPSSGSSVPSGPAGVVNAEPLGEQPDVRVTADEVAAAGSVQAAAQQELLARMNERGADGRLTDAAQQLRQDFYDTLTSGKPNKSAVVPRQKVGEVLPDERIFTVGLDSGTVEVKLPLVAQDGRGVLTFSAAVEGTKVETWSLPFSGRMLELTAAKLRVLQSAVDRWRASSGRPAEGGNRALAPEDRARIEAAAQNPEAVEVVAADDPGGALGEAFARTIQPWLEAGHPGERIVRVFTEFGGPGTFDQIYARVAPDSGQILGFVIVEAKNPGADLGSRLGADGQGRYLQGHREYVRSILQEMMALTRNERVAVLDLANLVEARVSLEEHAHTTAVARATEAAKAAEAFRVRQAEQLAEVVAERVRVEGQPLVAPARKAAKAAGATAKEAKKAGANAAELPAKAVYVEAYQAASAAFVTGDSVAVAEAAAAEAAARMAEAESAVARAASDPSDPALAEQAALALELADQARAAAAAAASASAFAMDYDAAYQREYKAAYAQALGAVEAGQTQVPTGELVRVPTTPTLEMSFDAGEAMSRSLEDGTLEYLTVRAEVDQSVDSARPHGVRITAYSMTPDDGGDTGGTGPVHTRSGQDGPVLGPQPVQTPDDQPVFRLFESNEVGGPRGALKVGEQVVADLTAVVPDPSPRIQERLAVLAARAGLPVVDGRVLGWRFFGNSGLGALLTDLPPAELAAYGKLEEVLVEQLEAGAKVKLTVSRMPQQSADAPAYGYAVQIDSGPGRPSVYSARSLARLVETLTPPATTAPATEGTATPVAPEAERSAPEAGRSGPGDQTGGPTDPADPQGPGGPTGPEGPSDGGPGTRPRHRLERFVPGWVLVSVQSGELLEGFGRLLQPTGDPAAPDSDAHPLSVDLTSIEHEGQGVYKVRTQSGETFRLLKRVGPLEPGVKLEYSVQLGETPIVDLQLSDRLTQDEIAPLLARVLAESVRIVRGEVDGPQAFRPDGAPEVDAVQRPADAADRAELRQLGLIHEQVDSGRRAAVQTEIRKLALAMGVASGQPNAELLRSLLTQQERDVLDRVKVRAESLDDIRVSRRGYLVKAALGPGWSAIVIGSAAAVFTGNPLVGLGIAIPTVVNAFVGSMSERYLDALKQPGKKPAYVAERDQREFDYRGIHGLLDGPEPVRPPVVKMPRATKWSNYLVRYTTPTLATAAVAGALTLFGVPALSTAMVIASSALAKSLAERLVDTKKLEFRLRRVDATERIRLSDPALYSNQLVTELAELRTRLERIIALLDVRSGNPAAAAADVVQQPPPGVAPVNPTVPGAPPFRITLAVQLIDNVSAAARRVFVGGEQAVDIDPTELARIVNAQLEGLLNAVGPGLFGSVTGALGDKYLINHDEAANDARKLWARTEQEARQTAALAELIEPRLQQLRELADQLETLTGAQPDLAARAADRGLPAPAAGPDGPRPSGQAPWRAYVIQVAAAALGGAASAVALDLVFDLPDLGVVLTVAGAAGAMLGTPIARYNFRRTEIDLQADLEPFMGWQAVKRGVLLQEQAVVRYLVEQLVTRGEQVTELTEPRVATEAPADTAPRFTDHVRAAGRRAELDNVPPGRPESDHDLEVRGERVEALRRIDRLAADVDRLEALGFRGELLTEAHARLRLGIGLYESIADSNGFRQAFPDLGAVDPSGGRRAVGVTDQVRLGVEQAIRRLVAEPAGKPLLAERLIALEQLAQAARAVEHHAIHGTDDSRALVQEQLDQALEEAERLWREAGVPNGLVLPELSVLPGLDRVGGQVTIPVRTVPSTGPVEADQGGRHHRPDSFGEGVLERNHQELSGALRLFPADATVGRAGLGALERGLVSLVEQGYQVEVTIERMARPGPAADPYRFTVRITTPNLTGPGATEVHGPATVSDLVSRLGFESAPGRHQVEESTGRHHLEDTPSRLEAEEPAGRPAADESSGRHHADESTGRHHADESSGRHHADGPTGRQQSDEPADPQAVDENEGGGRHRVEDQADRSRLADRADLPGGRHRLLEPAQHSAPEPGRHHASESGRTSVPEATDRTATPVVPQAVQQVVAESVAEVLPDAIPLRYGGVRATPATGCDIVLDRAALDEVRAEARRVLAEGNDSELARAAASRRLAALVAALGAGPRGAAAPSPVEDNPLDVAATRRTAERIARQATRLAEPPDSPPATVAQPAPGGPAAPAVSGTPAAPETTGATDASGSATAPEGPGGTVHAPEVRGTRFVADGPATARDLSSKRGRREAVREAVQAARAAVKADFGGLITGQIDQVSDGVIVVQTEQHGPQHFKVSFGSVFSYRVAATKVRTGSVDDPHLVRLAPGLASDQLTRAWVHEIGHTLQEKAAPRSRLRRLLGRPSAHSEDACVAAQFNEFRLLARQLATADAAARAGQAGAADTAQALANDLQGLGAAIEARGHQPPVMPWNTSPLQQSQQAPVDGFVAGVADQVHDLQRQADELRSRVEAKQNKAIEAAEAARQAEQTAVGALEMADSGRFARAREAQKEAAKQAEVQQWHEQVAAAYQTALDQLEKVAQGYQTLLADARSMTPQQRATTASGLVAELTGYEQKLTAVAPPLIAWSSLLPTDWLPHLSALTDRVNAVLVANGVDYRFTQGALQQRLSAEFGQLVTNDGAVLQVGHARPIELRLRLSLSDLVEVLDPSVRASETMIGLLPQSPRKHGITQNGRTGASGSFALNSLTQLFGEGSWLNAIGQLVTVKGEQSSGRGRSVSSTGAQYGQDGAVEDNRGESLLYAAHASWQLQARKPGEPDHVLADLQVDSGRGKDVSRLRAWASHAYTVLAPTQTFSNGMQPSGRLPNHTLTSLDGLQSLADKVFSAFGDQLARFGDETSLLREQIQSAINHDLPSRLTESTEQSILRPLQANGRPVGHLQIKTTARYERTELVGPPSTAHWQERVRVGFSNAGGQQNFSASTSFNATVGYGGQALTDLGDTSVDVGPSVSGGRSVNRSESLSAGGVGIHVGVQRYTGPTQGYRLVFDHEVTLVLNGESQGSVTGETVGLIRLQTNDAYRHGLPVAESAFVHDQAGNRVLDNGEPVLRGDPRSGVDVPGRRVELANWSADGAGRVSATGPGLAQRVTGGEEALADLAGPLAERGFLPPLDAKGDPDLSRMTADPLERQAQLLNLTELRTQLSDDRLEAGYDIAVQQGIVVSLTRPMTGRGTETISLRIDIRPGPPSAVGVTDDEAMVTLNIGSDTVGLSSGWSKSLPWNASPFGLSQDGAGGGIIKSGVSYGRQALGLMMGWFTGGTFNQVTLVESRSAVAAFEVPHRIEVTELGPQEVVLHAGTPGTSARILIDTDLLPSIEVKPTQVTSGPLNDKFLDRTTLIALDTQELSRLVEELAGQDATARHHLAALLDPRHLLAHPEWARTAYRTDAIIRGAGPVSTRNGLTISGQIADVVLLGISDAVVGDINLALSSHGLSVGQSTGGSAALNFGATADNQGGTASAEYGKSSSTSRTEQTISGVERLTIEVGRHYLFAGTAALTVTADGDPVKAPSTVVFQVAERDVLQFLVEGELTLPLAQVADAVERYLNGSLELDNRLATGLIRRYRDALAAAETANEPTPALSASHTARVLLAKLQPGKPTPGTKEARLESLLDQAEQLDQTRTIQLPEHYQSHLGSSLVEQATVTENGQEVTMFGRVVELMTQQLGLSPESDPMLPRALFADLAGKRWWGRLEDMLGPEGFNRTYAVGKTGQFGAQRVTLTIQAEFTGPATSLGVAKNVISIVQRYLYGDRSSSATTGQSLGAGLDGGLEEGKTGSVGTDRTDSTTVSIGEQTTRLERLATFDGLHRVRRGVKYTVKVTPEPTATPARTRLGRTVSRSESPLLPVEPVQLTGEIDQLIPARVLPELLPNGKPAPVEVTPSSPGQPVGSLNSRGLPAAYFVEGAEGNELSAAIIRRLAEADLLGQAGVDTHEVALKKILAAAAMNASFSRMAQDDGFDVLELPLPGYTSGAVKVQVAARVVDVQSVSRPFEAEIGEVNRGEHTVTHTVKSGRLAPFDGGVTTADSDSGLSGGVTAADQLADQTTDGRGGRRERSRFEMGLAVTVRVEVKYDVRVIREEVQRSGEIRPTEVMQLEQSPRGTAYLTMFESDYRQVQQSLPTKGTPPPTGPVQAPPGPEQTPVRPVQGPVAPVQAPAGPAQPQAGVEQGSTAGFEAWLRGQRTPGADGVAPTVPVSEAGQPESRTEADSGGRHRAPEPTEPTESQPTGPTQSQVAEQAVVPVGDQAPVAVNEQAALQAIVDVMAVASPGAIALRDGGYRVTSTNGHDAVIERATLDELRAEVRRLLDEGNELQVAREAVSRRIGELVKAPGTTPQESSVHPIDLTAGELAADRIARRAARLAAAEAPATGNPAQTLPTAPNSIPTQAEPTTPNPTLPAAPNADSQQATGPVDEGGKHGDTVHAPEVRNTRFVADGRPADAPARSMDALVGAALEASESDFGADLVGRPDRVGPELVMVQSRQYGQQVFRVSEGPVRSRRVAATKVRRGTLRDPHLVRFAPGLADNQLTRAWVHEITHTLRDLDSPRSRLRHLLGRSSAHTVDACVTAQFNEFRLLIGQWSAAAEAVLDGQPNAVETEQLLRQDLVGLAEAIEARGHQPPAMPWNADFLSAAAADSLQLFLADVAGQVDVLQRTVDDLRLRVAAKERDVLESEQLRQQAEEAVRNAIAGADSGRFAREHAAHKEIAKQTEMAIRREQLAAAYKVALQQAEIVAQGYEQLLTTAAGLSATERSVAASELAEQLAAYKQSLAAVAPPLIAMSSLLPTDWLPHLSVLTDRVNAVLAANGVDHRFTAGALQQRLFSQFGQLVTADGTTIQVGETRPVELQFRLSLSELVEVLDPAARTTETTIGMLSQLSRRVGLARNGTTGASGTLALQTLTRLFGETSWVAQAGQLVSAKVQYGSGHGRSQTITGAQYGLEGAFENNHGESALFVAKASWRVTARPLGEPGVQLADVRVTAGNKGDTSRLRAWASHVYTTAAPADTVERGTPPAGRLPNHVLTSLSGLQRLTDQVFTTFGDQLSRFGDQTSLLHEQIRSAINHDLPSRLSESTERSILQPLQVAGRPVGHLQIKTTVRYELVGGSSISHWLERFRFGYSNATVQQGFSASSSVNTTLGFSGDALNDLGDSQVDLGPSATGGRSLGRTESMAAGGIGVHIGVQRYIGPTQGYRLVMDHQVTLVLNGELQGSVTGETEGLARLRTNDAYRHGLPIAKSALVLDANGVPLVENGEQVLRGDPRRGLQVPGRRLELPSWMMTALGRFGVVGPGQVQDVTGGEAAVADLSGPLAERGFLPWLDANGDPDLSRMTTDPVAWQAQLLNLTELRAQLSVGRLETGFDIAVQSGIVVTLTRPTTNGPAETLSLLVTIHPGQAARSGLSYARRSLGRMVRRTTGGSVLGASGLETKSPQAIIEVATVLRVTELGARPGTGIQHQGSPGTSARVLLDSDLLPSTEFAPTQVSSGPLTGKLLDRAVLLALDASALPGLVPDLAGQDPAARHHVAAFLDPRHLLAHPEWTRTTYRTDLIVRGAGPASKRGSLAVSGQLSDAVLLGISDDVTVLLNLALNSHGLSTGRSTGGATSLFAGLSGPGMVSGQYGTSTSTSHTRQTTTGVERWVIETGRQYLFSATTKLSVSTGSTDPATTEAVTVFHVAERDVLQFHVDGELNLPPAVVADAVERFVQGHLELDRRLAGALIRDYRRTLDAAVAANEPLPALSLNHGPQELLDRLLAEGVQPAPGSETAQLDLLLDEVADLDRTSAVELPAQYRENLGSSVIEAATVFDQGREVALFETVRDFLADRLDLGPAGDPVLAEALFADLAGRRWLAGLEDLLGSDGFIRSYPISRAGQFAGQQVQLRIRAAFTGQAVSLGVTNDAVSRVNRYLFEDEVRTSSTGRSAGVGLEGGIEAGHSASLGTDRTDSSEVAITDQTLHVERMATSEGLQRVQRELGLVIEVTTGAPAAPGRGQLALGRGTDPALSSTETLTLTGQVIQLIPVRTIAGPAPVQATSSLGEPIRSPDGRGLPAGSFTEIADRNALYDAVLRRLGESDLLGPDGVMANRTELSKIFGPISWHATFSRMAQPDGFRSSPLPLPGYSAQALEVRMKATVLKAERTGVAGDSVELGEQHRGSATVTHTVSSGRLVPVDGGATVEESGQLLSGGVTAGDQLADQTTDTRGLRREWTRFERARAVAVRLDVRYDVELVRQRFRRTGGVSDSLSVELAPVPQGSAYVTMSESDYRQLELFLASDQTAPSPADPGGPTVHAPAVPGSRFDVGGRAAGTPLTAREAVEAAVAAQATDFDGLIDGSNASRGGPVEIVNDEMVVVHSSLHTEPQHFKVEPGVVRTSRVAATTLRTGTPDDPHLVRMDPELAGDQLTRAWVHEISHSLHEDGTRTERLGRLLEEPNGHSEDACVAAQLNEVRFLARQWTEAVAASDAGTETLLRGDLEGLADAIEARGHPRPTLPWESVPAAPAAPDRRPVIDPWDRLMMRPGSFVTNATYDDDDECECECDCKGQCECATSHGQRPCQAVPRAWS
jgi:hypothetical protein